MLIRLGGLWRLGGLRRLGTTQKVMVGVVAVLMMANVGVVASFPTPDSGTQLAKLPRRSSNTPSATELVSTTTTVPPTTTTTVAPDAGAAGPVVSLPGTNPGADLAAYSGLGTWVDAYDFAPEFQSSGAPPPITPDTVDAMADQGIRTLYLQASKDDVRSPGDIVRPELVGAFLTRAHARGIKVVAWFLPKLSDLDSDYRHLMAMHGFEAAGQRFDSVAIDIEWRAGVADHAQRSARLVELSRRLRANTNGQKLGAIVMPPVVTDVINPSFWPGFPWLELAPLYDVWMPMGYWTNRTQASGWRDTFRYTDQNIALLRRNLANPSAVVHPIGGIGDTSTDEDYRGFVQAARNHGSIGISIYDYKTTAASAWPVLIW